MHLHCFQPCLYLWESIHTQPSTKTGITDEDAVLLASSPLLGWQWHISSTRSQKLILQAMLGWLSRAGTQTTLPTEQTAVKNQQMSIKMRLSAQSCTEL